MRVFLLAVVALCCGVIGFKVRDYYKRRKKLFSDLIKFLKKVKEEVCLKKNYVRDVFSVEGSEDVKKIVANKGADLPLSKEEIREIREILLNVGKSVVDYEEEKIEDSLLKIKRYEDDASKKYDQKGVLSVKMGFLVGIAIFILLV